VAVHKRIGLDLKQNLNTLNSDILTNRCAVHSKMKASASSRFPVKSVLLFVLWFRNADRTDIERWRGISALHKVPYSEVLIVCLFLLYLAFALWNVAYATCA